MDGAGPTPERLDELDGEPVIVAEVEIATDHRNSRRRRWLAWIAAISIVAMLAVEIVLVAPYVKHAWHLIIHPSWGFLVLALAAQAASMGVFARLQRRMLPGDVKIKLGQMMAVTYAANAMSVTLPGGPVMSSTYTFRKLRAWGVNGPVASVGLVSSGVLSSLTLAVIIVLGATFARSGTGDAIEVAAETVLAVAALFLARALLRRPDMMLRMGRRTMRLVNRTRHRPAEAGTQRMREIVTQLSLIKASRRDWLIGLLYATLNWGYDLLCLVFACHAVGASGPGFELALVVYAAGKAAANVPLLPGGLGVVDAALVLTLTRGGFTADTATAGVIVYRLISLGLVALVGWVFWLVGNRLDHRRTAGAAIKS